MKPFIIFFLLVFSSHILPAQKTFPIWPGKAAGSEDWNWKEAVDSVNHPGDPLVYNVVQPALTYYPADASVASGASVIICPGGSFCYLHTKTEGSDVAMWLNRKGVAAFVLTYRLMHSLTNDPMKEKTERSKDHASSGKLMLDLAPLVIADARQSIVYVRAHAAEWGIDPHKTGMMGFSAGGMLAAASVFDYTPENRPDFVAPIYPYVPASQVMNVSVDAPPLFLAAASDDELHLVPMSIRLYTAWLESGHSAEMHLYSKGGHGFGMNRKNQPSDTWIDRFGDWLQLQGFLQKSVK